MTNNLNIPAADLKKIENLTPEQLSAIRSNIQDQSMSDDETREAMMEAVGDGHGVEDFLPQLAVGDRVEGGETDEDRDTGRVVEVDGDQITVAWSCGMTTTQPADLLRKA